MDKADIIKIAHKCGLIREEHTEGLYEEALIDFAQHMIAIERRACACICDDVVDSERKNYKPSSLYTFAAAETCAARIRGRGIMHD